MQHSVKIACWIEENHMVTYRKGTKYANLKENPNVSLRMDNKKGREPFHGKGRF
ncbi:conserved hypothetical protein [delta proteobacterium NaphS2]|nr:conserved hypothetical protein [delta proteobacterium NaphS2]